MMLKHLILFQELFSDPKAIRTNCNEESNAVVSTRDKITVTLVCNGNQNGYFDIPKGTHKLRYIAHLF